MDVVYVVSSLIEVLLYVAGLVAGILVRRRDGAAGLLVAAGFGLHLLGVVLSFIESLALPAIIHATGTGSVFTFTYGVSVVLHVLSLAAFVLIFLGLLRLVRGRTTATPGVAR